VVVVDGLTGIDGRRIDPAVLDGRAVLVVNVASQCGLTPQYEGLERLQGRYGAAGFTVLGVPCNQFAGQHAGGDPAVLLDDVWSELPVD
jgi:glutathione peroxidase